MKRVSHQGVFNGGLVTPSTMGATLSWDARDPMRCQTPGGFGVVNLMGTYSEPYCVWNRGLGRYDVVTGPDALVGSNGWFGRSISNWQRYEPQTAVDTYRVRAVDANGAEDLANPSPADHIIDPAYQAVAPRYQAVAATAQFTMPVSVSSSFPRILAMYIGASGDTTGIDLDVTIGGASIRTSGPFLECIRDPKGGASDRWYVLWITIASNATTTGTMTLTLPQAMGWTTIAAIWEETATSTYTFPSEYVPRFGGTSTARPINALRIQEPNVDVRIGKCGWVGASIVMPHSSANMGSLPFGDLVRIRKTATDYVAIIMSSTENKLVCWMTTGGVTQAYLQLAASWEAGERLGVVFGWGEQLGSFYCMAALNGRLQEVDTSGAAPIGSATVHLGADSSAFPLVNNAANCCVSRIDISDRRLHRADIARLSTWYQDQCYWEGD